MLSFLRLSFLPTSGSLGLLTLRAAVGGSMLWLHGRDKLLNFTDKLAKFPVILVNSKVSLGIAVFAQVICAALLVVGLFSRFAALALGLLLGWIYFHKDLQQPIMGAAVPEVMLLYLAACVTIFLTGPGSFALDGAGSGGAPTESKKKH
jgi:putative oxidoreductase